MDRPETEAKKILQMLWHRQKDPQSAEEFVAGLTEKEVDEALILIDEIE